MAAAVGAPGQLYGASIAGYGSSVITYADGRQAPWMKMGFAARANALVLYGVLGAATPAQLQKLGPHTTGKGCLYLKRLSDIDEVTLRAILTNAAR